MSLPNPTSSIIAFVLTFCVGYVTLLTAYYQADRLPEFFGLDAFDKTIMTFIAGGIISVASLAFLNAPVISIFYETNTYSTLTSWLSRNFGIMVIIEVVLIMLVSMSIRLFLERNDETFVDYVS